MLVILLPAKHYESNKDFELVFGPFLNSAEKDVFQDEQPAFKIWKDL